MTDRNELLLVVSHMSEDDILSLKTDYYLGMKSSEIKHKYSIMSFKFSLGKCHYIFPLQATEEDCPNCNEKLFLLSKTREDQKKNSVNIAFCNSCGHQETADCNCDFCDLLRNEKAKEDTERKRQFLCEQIIFEESFALKINEISFRDKVLLGTLIQAGVEDDFITLKPFSNSSMPIFPSEDVLKLIETELKQKHIIGFSLQSSLDCFIPDYENSTFRYYWKKVCYKINIKEFYEDRLIAKEFLNPQSLMLKYPKNDPEIWEEIVYWEALSLFNYILSFFKIKYEVGKETEEFFWIVTKQLPLSIVYSIIYQSGKNTAAYSKTERCPKYIAYNSILQNMRTIRDKIIAGQFQRWEYNRPDKECPQSIVSQYYFNSILKICDKYWKMLPNEFFEKEEI